MEGWIQKYQRMCIGRIQVLSHSIFPLDTCVISNSYLSTTPPVPNCPSQCPLYHLLIPLIQNSRFFLTLGKFWLQNRLAPFCKDSLIQCIWDEQPWLYGTFNQSVGHAWVWVQVYMARLNMARLNQYIHCIPEPSILLNSTCGGGVTMVSRYKHPIPEGGWHQQGPAARRLPR